MNLSNVRPDLVVTRHDALVAYLIEIGLATGSTPVVRHVDNGDDLVDKVVVGVLPLHLAALCRAVVVVPLDIPIHLRNVELDIEQVRSLAGDPVAYTVIPHSIRDEPDKSVKYGSHTI